MNDKKNLGSENILDECISRLQNGEDALEILRRDYPQHVQDLAPLADLARQIQTDFRAPAPRKNFARNSKIRLLNRLRAAQGATTAAKPRERPRKRFSWRPARAVTTLLLVFILAITSTGVAWASSDALPGDALYPVKRGVEEIRLGFTFSDRGDAELLSAFTAERMDEIEALIHAGRDDYLDEALQDYEVMLERLVVQVTTSSQAQGQGALEDFAFNFAHQLEVIERVKNNAPKSVQAKMEEVKARTQHGKDVVETIRQGGDPSDLAPGQIKKQTPQSDSDEEGRGLGKTKTPKPKKKKTPGPPPWANPDGLDKEGED